MKRQDIKRRPLSDTVIESLEPEAKEYRERHADGVYLRVRPNGLKDWQLRYKREDGSWSWMGLGAYGKAAHQLTGQQARQRALELSQEARSKGTTPIEARALSEVVEPEQESFAQLTAEWLATKRASKGWTDGTFDRAKGMLEKHILPTMGNRGYNSIPASEWFKLFKRMEAEGILKLKFPQLTGGYSTLGRCFDE